MESLEKCTKVGEQSYCDNVSVMNKNREACEIKALSDNERNLQENCGTKILKMERILFVKTESENRYLTFATELEYGKLITKDGFKNLVFNGTQMLEINENAKLYVDELEIKFTMINVKTEVGVRLATKLKVNLEDFDVKEKNVILPKMEKPLLIESDEFTRIGIQSRELTKKK